MQPSRRKNSRKNPPKKRLRKKPRKRKAQQKKAQEKMSRLWLKVKRQEKLKLPVQKKHRRHQKHLQKDPRAEKAAM